MPANVGQITFDDGTGLTTFGNGRGAPVSRFNQLAPKPGMHAAEAEAMADGTRYVYLLTEYFDATLQLTHIANADVPTATRFVRHATLGGFYGLVTGDLAARAYPTCQSPTDQPPTLVMTDRKLRLWTLTVVARNLAALPTDILCLY